MKREDSYTLDVDGTKTLVLSVRSEPADAPPTGELTAAEASVAALILQGLSNAEIAAQRGASRSTVKNQVRSIFQKLGVASRAELAFRLAQR